MSDTELDNDLRRGAGCIAILQLLQEKGIITDDDLLSFNGRAKAIYEHMKKDYDKRMADALQPLIDALKARQE